MKRKLRKIHLFINKYKIILFIFTAISFIAVGLWLNSGNHENTVIDDSNLFDIQNIGRSQPMFQSLVDIVSKSYKLITEHCIYGDAIRINTNECLNYSGMGLLAVESLETLLIAGRINEFQTLANYVKKNLDCSQFQDVNIRSFWQRYIASFIGVYKLTGDHQFLNIAQKCSQRLVSILDGYSDPMQKVNFVKGTASNYNSQPKETKISDVTSGLPELIELYKITQDSFYEFAYMKKFSLIPNNFSNLTYDVYDSSTYRPGSRSTYVKESFVNHIFDLLESYQLKKFSFIEVYIPEALRWISTVDLNLPYVLTYIELKAQSLGIQVQSPGIELWKDFIVAYFPPFIENLYFTESIQYQLKCFNFNAIPLKIVPFWSSDLQKNVSSYVYDTIRTSLSNRCIDTYYHVYQTNITTSNLLGQWIKEGLIYEGNLNVITNQQGHILEILY